MLSFVLNLQAYVTNEVIEPHWHTFMATLSRVQNIDEGKKKTKKKIENKKIEKLKKSPWRILAWLIQITNYQSLITWTF